MTYGSHGVKVEAQVVESIEHLGQYLVRSIEMPQVSPGVAPANPAPAIGIGRIFVARILHLLDRHLSLGSEKQPMARRSGGQDTVHHVDSEIGVLHDLFRRAYPHQVARLLRGQMLEGGFDYLTRQ